MVCVCATQLTSGAMLMDGPVQGESGRIGGVGGGFDEPAVHADLEQVLRGDFVVVQAEGIDQVLMRWAGNPHRNMVEDLFGPA